MGVRRAPKASLHDGALARADALEQAAIAWADEQAVVLLVLGAPDLQHAHRLVAQADGAHVDLGAQRVDDLLHLRARLAPWAAALCRYPTLPLPYPLTMSSPVTCRQARHPSHQRAHPVRPACGARGMHGVARGSGAIRRTPQHGGRCRPHQARELTRTLVPMRARL